MKGKNEFFQLAGWIGKKWIVSWLCKSNPEKNHYQVMNRIYKGTVDEICFDEVLTKKVIEK